MAYICSRGLEVRMRCFWHKIVNSLLNAVQKYLAQVHKSLNYSTAAFSDYVKTNVSAPLKWIDSAKQVKMDIICETNECRLVLSPVLHCLLLLSLLHSTSSTSFFLLCLNNITAASCKHVINRQQEAYLVTPPQAIANFLLLWRHRSSI